MASAATPKFCPHAVGAYANCQHCGRPTCCTCSPRGVTLASLRLSLPLVFCVPCRDELAEIALGVEHSADVTCRDGQHATPAEAEACSPCHALRVAALFSATEAALARIEAERYHGPGEVRTNASRAAIAVARSVPLAAFNSVKGILGGAVGGGFFGAASGAIGGAALGLDAQNSAAAAAARVSAAAKRPAPTATIGKGGAAAAPATPPVSTAPTVPVPTGGEGGGDGGGSFSSVSLDPAPPTPAASAPAPTRAPRAAPLPSTPEARDADAAAELERILACKSAYAILGVEPTATADELRAAYRAKSLRYHPDRNAAPRAKDVSQALNNAWAVLGDEARRAAYDASGERDTGGLDLFSGIRVTRAGVAASAVGGVLGGLAGLAVGIVGGSLAGFASGLAATVSSSRDFATAVETAQETVLRAVRERRAAVREAVAWAAAHSPLDAPYFGPHHVRAELENSGSAAAAESDVLVHFRLVHGVASAAVAANAAAPRRRAPALAVPEDTLRSVVESGLAAAAAAAGVDVDAATAYDAPAEGTGRSQELSLAKAAGGGAVVAGGSSAATAAPPPAAARALAASLTQARPDRVWLARLLAAAEDAGIAVRRSQGMPDLPVAAAAGAEPLDYDEAEEAAAKAAAAAMERALTVAGGSSSGGGKVVPPTSALGLLAMGRGLMSAAAAHHGAIDSLEAWVGLAGVYEAWSAGDPLPGEAAAEAKEGGGEEAAGASAQAATKAATAAPAAAAAVPPPPPLPFPPPPRCARVLVAECPAPPSGEGAAGAGSGAIVSAAPPTRASPSSLLGRLAPSLGGRAPLLAPPPLSLHWVELPLGAVDLRRGSCDRGGRGALPGPAVPIEHGVVRVPRGALEAALAQLPLPPAAGPRRLLFRLQEADEEPSGGARGGGGAAIDLDAPPSAAPQASAQSGAPTVGAAFSAFVSSTRKALESHGSGAGGRAPASAVAASATAARLAAATTPSPLELPGAPEGCR